MLSTEAGNSPAPHTSVRSFPGLFKLGANTRVTHLAPVCFLRCSVCYRGLLPGGIRVEIDEPRQFLFQSSIPATGKLGFPGNLPISRRPSRLGFKPEFGAKSRTRRPRSRPIRDSRSLSRAFSESRSNWGGPGELDVRGFRVLARPGPGNEGLGIPRFPTRIRPESGAPFPESATTARNGNRGPGGGGQRLSANFPPVRATAASESRLFDSCESEVATEPSGPWEVLHLAEFDSASGSGRSPVLKSRRLLACCMRMVFDSAFRGQHFRSLCRYTFRIFASSFVHVYLDYAAAGWCPRCEVQLV